MKFTVLLLAVSVFQAVAADVLSQSPGLTMAYAGVDLKQVLDDIESQTDFRFLYHNETVANKTIDLDVDNKTWFEILEQIKVASDVDYQVLEDNLIVLTPVRALQDRVITGTITDTEGIPIIGASVTVKGTTVGTITDVDGNYRIDVPAGAEALVISYVGMLTTEVAIGSQTEISITMQIDAIGIDEVVVIGYGTVTKGALTGAVSTVDTDAMAIEASNDVTKALQGKVAGIQVLNDGRPGQSAEIRIRGLGTINDNNPLWIVDGVPASGPPPASMVANVSVLKDAASTAIYGARGANGVILVTTKSGKKNAPMNVEFSVRAGMHVPGNQQYDMFDTYQEVGDMYWLIAQNDGAPANHPIFGSGATAVVPDYLMPAGAMAGEVDHDDYDLLFSHQDGDGINQIVLTPEDGRLTNYFDEVYNNGMMQDYNLSVTGGTDKTTYAFSANYLDQEAIIKHSTYERFSAMANFTFDIKDWLKVGTLNNLGTQNWAGSRSNRGGGSIFNQIILTDNMVPLYDIMGNFAGSGVVNGGADNHPYATLVRAKDDTNKQLNMAGNIFVEISPVKGFKIKSLFGYVLSSYRNNNLSFANPESYRPNPQNSLTVSTGSAQRWNWTNTASYTLNMNNSKLELLAGTEAIRSENLWQQAYREGFFTTDLDFMYLDAGTILQTNNGNGTEWTLFSYFGRAHYEVGNKYLLDATVRRDGSSRFGAENRHAVFPAFAAGWRISNESFMSATENWLTNLKIRASWGQSGNDRIGDFNGFTTFGSNNRRSYYPIDGSDNSVTAGYQSEAFGNPEARWETTSTTNVALEASFLGFLNVTLDVWDRTTSDMLFAKGIASTGGRADIPSVNVGEMNNKGIDLLLNVGGQSESGEFSWDVTGVVSRYKNQIVELSGVEGEFLTGDSKRANNIMRAENGTAFPEFWGYEVDGIFQTQAEADAWPDAFGEGGSHNEPGHWRFVDKNGRDAEGNIVPGPDGVVDDADRDYLGSPHPDFTAGLSGFFRYKAFDLAIDFYGSYGNMIFADHRVYLENSTGGQALRSPVRLYESWGSPHLSSNEDATIPKIETDDAANLDAVNHYLEDGSFLRLRNLQIGFNAPATFNNRLGLKSVRVYVMASNLFTLTGYSGLDPEVGSYLDGNQDPGITKGIDTGTWPLVKQFMIGVNIGL